MLFGEHRKDLVGHVSVGRPKHLSHKLLKLFTSEGAQEDPIRLQARLDKGLNQLVMVVSVAANDVKVSIMILNVIH